MHRSPKATVINSSTSARTWPVDTLARVPYWVYQDDANYRDELRPIIPDDALPMGTWATFNPAAPTRAISSGSR